MQITRSLLWWSLLVATVSCQNETQELVGKVYYQDKVLSSIKDLTTAVTHTKQHVNVLAEQLISDYSRLSTSIEALQKSVDDNQVINEGMFAELTGIITSNTEAIQELETAVSNNQMMTHEKLESLKEIIVTGNAELESMIESLTTKVDMNQEEIRALCGELKEHIVAINLSLETISQLLASISIDVGNIENRLSGIESTLSNIYSDTSEILDILTISSCKTPGTSGVYKLQFPSIKVYCEMNTLDGAWLVIQQRVDLSTKFDRTWNDYKQGFGSVGNKENYWLGLEAIHQITSSGVYELAVEFRENSNSANVRTARYTNFRVAAESEKYKLAVSGYSNSRSTLSDNLTANNNAKFSTPDQDNDSDMVRDCAEFNNNNSGWWYTNCGNSNLNSFAAPFWNTLGTYSRMMIRRTGDLPTVPVA